MKSKKIEKKHIIIIAIILLAILIVVLLFNLFNKKEENHPVLDFLNYEVPYDGEAEIGDYKHYTIKIDDILENGYNNYVKYLVQDYEDWGDPIEGAVVEEDSKIQISLSLYNGEELLRTSDLVRLDLSQISFSKEITEELKKQLVGKASGATFEFTFKGTNDASLLSEEKDLTITYKGYLINVLNDYKYPELTDEWVREVTDYESIEDLKKNIMIDFLYEINYSEENYYSTLRDYLRYLIEEDSECTKNATALVNISDKDIRNTIQLLANEYGVTTETYIYNIYGMTEEEYYSDYVYNYSCAETLMVEIAMMENIDVSDEAYNKYLLEIAEYAGLETVEELLENYSYYYDEKISKQDFVAEVVLNKIIDDYVIVEDSQYQHIVEDMLEYFSEDSDSSEILDENELTSTEEIEATP